MLSSRRDFFVSFFRNAELYFVNVIRVVFDLEKEKNAIILINVGTFLFFFLDFFLFLTCLFFFFGTLSAIK